MTSKGSVLISTGAAAGAVICVVLGGVAGLVYDRISHVKEEKPAQSAQFSGPVDRLDDGAVRNN